MQQFKVSFFLHSKRNKEGKQLVQVRINLNGSRMFLCGTDICLSASDWDSKLERVKLKTAEGRMINNRLESLESEVLHIFHKHEYDQNL